MNILVTGGAGFIGSHLVDALCDRGDEVIVVDSMIDGHLENIQMQINSGKCILFQKDIRDKKFMLSELPKVDFIFHWAADPDVRNSVPEPMNSFDHNIIGTINVLEYARLHTIKYLMFASSGGTVYGQVEKFPITEENLLSPISPYGATKAAAEMFLSAYACSYDIKIASVRFANIFGERSRHGVGFDFYYKLKKQPEFLSILGDGTQQKSYMYIKDAIKAVLLVANHLQIQEKPYDFFNVGSESWYTVEEIAEIYERNLGLTDVIHKYTGGEKGWKGDVAKIITSIEKLKQLGFTEQFSFEQGVKNYIQWLSDMEKF